jgi:hypothetical protein
MIQLFQDNITAVFALIGTFVGATLSFVGTWILHKNEVKAHLLEKVLDRRITANEQVIQLAQSMRIMVSLGRTDEDGELERTPNILTAKETFEEWIQMFTQTCCLAMTWLSTDLTRELNFVQDYTVTLYEWLRPVNSEKFPEIGAIIRQDFIDFSAKLEQMAFDFFARDLTKFKLNDLRKWHKYPRKETEKRLSETVLMTKADKIIEIISAPQP